MTDVVTMGETMAVFSNADVGPLRHATHLRLGAAGAESTVAIGVSRLGLSAAYIGRVGADELGRAVLARLRGEGLDVSAVRVDPDAPTGLMVKERRTTRVSRVVYYRSGSAGSRLSVEDVPASLAAAKVLHVSGVTPALSESALAATRHAVRTAKDAGVTVSLDYNYRAALWTPERARDVLRELTADADIVFAGEDEARLVTGGATPRDLAAYGPAQAVVKLGAAGAVALVDGAAYRAAAVPVPVADPVGAGDAFVAGYLAALLQGQDPGERLRAGCRLGAFAVSVPGDWEGLPLAHEVGLLDEADGEVLR
ncbi:sugar kinase [Virgisporangium aliadipatigenens]|uniref:Sugar kinase n=1 Tax=Virgisporangium aliadipatigenens TaxID=741659 RepID=A0A8J3YHJ0_9ACTN|nr:sugar kinase [Virgisporangium aliadipatigenens]GIJ45364.1 sugar kinase [Virgisporangium aliadipatigenens]